MFPNMQDRCSSLQQKLDHADRQYGNCLHSTFKDAISLSAACPLPLLSCQLLSFQGGENERTATGLHPSVRISQPASTEHNRSKAKRCAHVHGRSVWTLLQGPFRMVCASLLTPKAFVHCGLSHKTHAMQHHIS